MENTQPNTSGAAGYEDFAALFEQNSQLTGPIAREGDIVKGKVISLAKDHVIVDFGHKCEGLVPLAEFRTIEGEYNVQPGDEVEVYVDSLDIEDGLAVLSKEKADAFKIWDNLQAVTDNDGVIDGVVVAKVKGGLSVDIGVKAFLPASQIDVRLPSSLDKLVGKRFKFKILKLNKRKGNIIVSRRALIEKDRDYARQEVFANLSEGQAVSGTIKNITDYGAFVDLGGVDGLLHITDITWGRINHPSDMLTVGQDIQVKVLKIDQDTGKVSLGMKQLTQDPWESVHDRYPIGERIRGKVVSLADYGAFVELEGGIEGLVHVSEMSWSRKAKHPSKIVNVGDVVEAAILDVDPSNRRISLGMKQITDNPWNKIASQFNIGQRVSGPVKNITDFGVFIGLADDVDGLIHISDLSWAKLARPISAAFPKKADVEAIILNLDIENERISLGVKQLTDDPWPIVEHSWSIGTRLKGKVSWIGEKAIAVDLDHNIEGYVSRTELPEEYQADTSKRFPIGQEFDVVVHSIDEKERKVTVGFILEGN